MKGNMNARNYYNNSTEVKKKGGKEIEDQRALKKLWNKT